MNFYAVYMTAKYTYNTDYDKGLGPSHGGITLIAIMRDEHYARLFAETCNANLGDNPLERKFHVKMFTY